MNINGGRRYYINCLYTKHDLPINTLLKVGSYNAVSFLTGLYDLQGLSDILPYKPCVLSKLIRCETPQTEVFSLSSLIEVQID